MTAKHPTRAAKHRRRNKRAAAQRRLAAGAASLSLTATLLGLTAVGPEIATAAAEDGVSSSSGNAERPDRADSGGTDDQKRTSGLSGSDNDSQTDRPTTSGTVEETRETDRENDRDTELKKPDTAPSEDAESEDLYEAIGAGPASPPESSLPETSPAETPPVAEPTPAVTEAAHSSPTSTDSAEHIQEQTSEDHTQPAALTYSAAATTTGGQNTASEAPLPDTETLTPSASSVISLDPPNYGREFVAGQIEALIGTGRTMISLLPLPYEFKEWLYASLNGTRRALFNQAPWLNPTQISAEGGVPISGTLGAVDLEGDEIRYAIVTGPTSGTVVIAPDGSFVYTPNAGFTGVDNFVVSATDLGEHINLFDLFRAASTHASLLVNERAVSFIFNYTTGSQYWTSDARTALYRAANNVMREFIVTKPVIITYEITGENTVGTSLASAESALISSGAGFFPTVVQHKLLTGIDANGAAADGHINWNFAYPWAFGDYVSAQQYDFDMVAMHEFLHSLGFMSYAQPSSTGTQRGWTLYDSFLRTAGGSKLIGSDFRLTSPMAASLTGGSGSVFFGGNAAQAAYGGLVPLYAPLTWAGGSSISHLDSTVFTGPNRQLMNPQVPTGHGIRALSAVERAIMQDLGYTLAPMDASSMLALVGFVFIRRRRVEAE
ncbi:MAG: Ig-like domain-containing protein [Mycolicibacterium neoaurum]|uniref:Ig-like domain-containing protein n=1 Tax=Mycolicibacterium neoaurum TaxID=1795 RepID=UPI002FF67F5D